MEPGAEKSEVDLGKIVARFNAWQRVMRLVEWNSETRFNCFPFRAGYARLAAGEQEPILTREKVTEAITVAGRNSIFIQRR